MVRTQACGLAYPPYMHSGASRFQKETNVKRRIGEPQAPSLRMLENAEFKPGLPGYYEGIFVKVGGQTFDTEVQDKM